jgi:hypothetical protein
MKQLTSKIQYHNFETGEFIEKQKRTYDATISLIETFPWNEERTKLVVDLTNPSITIEGNNNDYLKLAVFFNEKYVLHYFNNGGVLFTKSFLNLKDSYLDIQRFFDQPDFDVSAFKKENTWLQYNLKHFVSQDFNYTLTKKTTWQFLFSTSGFNLVFSIFFLLLSLAKGFHPVNPLLVLFFLFIFFTAGGGLNLVLFFNYYFYAKNKRLIISRGNDAFYYGDKNAPTCYNKKDIMQFTTTRVRNSKSQISSFAFVKIEFNDAREIVIPNIFVDYTAMERKLFEYHEIEVNKFPYIQY